MTGAALSDENKLDVILTNFMASEKNVEELSIALNKIEKMVFTVRDISTKTDLLSLNASIEAVRAGQSGKGFAVVADEVARLAEKTQDSISEIETAVDSFKDGFENLRDFLIKTKELIKISMEKK
ncbi:methyl-accepting chemotaxis protein [Silvanigrella sp.]|jgi:methyl-accepting chemotaxis protein|uniref:methyl-accepting chemotaxis protein n=1 Tax=Silvanigrella sp. TaxID=2024976 RepID=UPI0037C60796